jgi:tetratricopeptide (TPR) repeat protein
MADFRVFVSAVSSEFGTARDMLAASLRSRDLMLRVQSDFHQEAAADTTLRKLHDYIRDCSAVVCIIGQRSGAMPPAASAAPFAHMLPPGVAEASYTQWEFFFARHYRRRLSLHIATGAWKPGQSAADGDRADLQAALIQHVRQQGLDRDSFDTADRLCHLVLREKWPLEKPVKPVLLPYASLGELFIGRDDDLTRLHDSLNRGAGAAITSSALLGLGGMGKTRLAVEYALRHADDYTALLFAIAETPDDLRRNLAALTGILGLRALNAADDAARLQGVLGWLGNNPGWLLILDSVDSREAAAAVGSLMGRLQGGRVLMTSRLASVPAEFARLDLDLLAPDDAARFLLRRTEGRRRATQSDATEAAALANDLGCLALALEQAGAYIAAEPLPMSLAGYRALLRDSFAEVMAWSDPNVTHYPRAAAATWQTSVAKLDDAARALLERLAFLAPDPVPAFLLDVEAPGAVPAEARSGLRGLAVYSLMNAAADGGSFTVHRLVQDVTRRGLAAGTAMLRVTEALGWVSAAFVGEPNDVRAWPGLDPLAPHVDAVTAYADTAGIADPTGRLMNQLGLLFHAKALHARAEPLYRRALAIDEARLGEDHPDVARDLNNVCQLLQATNRLGEAEPLIRRALAINEATYGNYHPAVPICLNNLAQLLQATNRLSEAEPLMRRALAISEAIYGNDHPYVAGCLNNLGMLLQATNRLIEAEPLLRRALAIDEATYGNDHPNVATGLNNLAQLMQVTSRLDEAKPLLRRALAVSEAGLGYDHPHVAIVLINLARVLQATNRLGEAEPLLRRALTIDEATYGSDHPNVARDLNHLAYLLRTVHRFDEAEPLMFRSIAIFAAFQRDTGHAHPHGDSAMRNYTRLLTALGRSEQEIEAALATLRHEVGLDQA